jgi:hypothetical protein
MVVLVNGSINIELTRQPKKRQTKKAQRYGNNISEVTPNVESIGWKILYAD